MQANDRAQTMSEQSSPTSPTASAFYDPDSSSWRMCQASFPLDLDEEADWTLLQRLPDWGTTAGGALCVQATPEHLIAVRDGSALLGTPTTATSGRSPEHGQGRAPNPQELAALLATPTAWLGRRPSQAIGDAARWHDPERSNELSDQMAALLPTPRAQNGEPRNMKPWIRPLDQPQNLENAIARLLPTPTVNGVCNDGPSQWERNSLPLPIVALQFTSALTWQRSSDGNGYSDDEHPTLPMIEASDPSSSSS
tara:strand:+ start:138 stop:896 length:759 start_codon:yes stop_codon:yes gene_type:complete